MKMDLTGQCSLCGTAARKATMTHHLRRCSPRHDARHGSSVDLFHLRVEGAGTPFYWLDVEAKGGARLADLDWFLRDIWLECCGHCSAFRIGQTSYMTRSPGALMPEGDERSLRTPVREALGSVSGWFRYEYDFGSTTELRLRVVGCRRGVMSRQLIRLLARNSPPVWPCSVCGGDATALCTFCIEERAALFCGKHAKVHKCDHAGLLPVVNSPRVGVCAYSGQA